MAKPGGGGAIINHWGFTVWLAGGGVKGGLAYGSTDEFGYRAAEKSGACPRPCTPLSSTSSASTTPSSPTATPGRDFRLTDVHGHVVRDILAIVDGTLCVRDHYRSPRLPHQLIRRLIRFRDPLRNLVGLRGILQFDGDGSVDAEGLDFRERYGSKGTMPRPGREVAVLFCRRSRRCGREWLSLSSGATLPQEPSPGRGARCRCLPERLDVGSRPGIGPLFPRC